MTSNYRAIRLENEERYGTDIGRIGPMLLADRYDDRTHFIFELLQNAEDALGRREQWNGAKAVNFALSGNGLLISHFGKPFDEADVRGVCGIAQSTKDLTAIGRFGIGFKSVYTFTDRPEIHSGNEDFAIDSFVRPTEVSKVERLHDDTLISLPLRPGDSSAHKEIADGLRRLGPTSLLFLRHIEEITWSVDEGPSGIYLRSKPVSLGANAQRITVVGQASGQPDFEENWLIFGRGLVTETHVVAGQVEIAFSIVQVDGSPRGWSVQPIVDSPLVVFFPTVLSTHLGFLVQGPYRTTPSRDNVPRNDSWNQQLVRETAALLIESLRWLRDEGLLNATALCCLPLDRSKFPESAMFAPLFVTVREALKSEPLLPRFDGGYVPASEARLARTQELRELLNANQLGALFDGTGDVAWLSGDITQDRSPELRQYLIRELGVTEVTPEMILSKLNKVFLEQQSASWIVRLYEFLNGQPALRRRLDNIPIVRLADGTHVVARANGQPLAFLPSAIETGFPTMHREVCATVDARNFLVAFGITEPDPVDDVVWNILPKYQADENDVGADDYAADIDRICSAFCTDSKTHRDKLLTALRATAFVMVVDAGDGSRWVSRPAEVYLATDRLKELFAGVADVLLVDDSYSCLRGESVRELLEACGATRYLQPTPVTPNFTWEQRRDMRIAAGCESSSGGDTFQDNNLRGLDKLLTIFPGLDKAAQAKKAALIWEAIGDVESRRGTGIFSGTYRWTYVHGRSANFDAAFVRQLNDAAWVSDANGELQKPEFVLFETLGWEANPFLLSKIRFKPPIIETLAKEAGIDPAMLDLIKKSGLTLEELKLRLGIQENETHQADESKANDFNHGSKYTGKDYPKSSSVSDTKEGGQAGDGNGSGGGSGSPGASGTRPDTRSGSWAGGHSGAVGGGSTGGATRSAGGRQFISYVGTHLEEDTSDPDGLEQSVRMALEESAIKQILKHEPQLNRTPAFNPGFDLYECNEDGEIVRWIEVKAMTSSLDDRPVGLSHTQFHFARECGTAFWLYVVEHASDASAARVLRIQDPVGKACTFTFDRGWALVAEENNTTAVMYDALLASAPTIASAS